MASRRDSAPIRVKVNRAPVLTLWAAIVAERLGHRGGDIFRGIK